MPPPDLRPPAPRRLARIGKTLTATVAVLAAVTAGLMLNSRNDRAEAAVVWNEEFNGAAGAGVDTSHWNFDTGGGGFGNNELEYYTSGTSNVAQDGQGHLVITARRESGGHSCWYGTCQWTSGRIQTAGKFTQLYGHIEARMQIPEGNGLWPAFWMLGGSNWPTDGEIDIMENVGRTPNTVYGTIHGPGYSGGNAVGGTRTLSAPLGNAFHNYAVDWSPNLIVWTIDGSEYFRATPASTRGNPWVYSHPFFIILNLAVGGSFPGSPDGSTPSSNRLVVDYIHVNTTLGGGGTTTPPTTGPTTTPPTNPTTPPAGSTTWAPGVAYHVGDVVTYNGVSYRCLQAHTSIVTWEPPNTPALWQRL